MSIAIQFPVKKTRFTISPGPDLRFAIDFGSLQVGYVQFTANGPVRSMAPYGKPLPAQPQDKDDSGKLVSKPGFYVLIAGKGVGGIREWCSNADAADTLAGNPRMRTCSPVSRIVISCGCAGSTRRRQTDRDHAVNLHVAK